ncbi:MAG: STAS domain-containing protein [Acidobacteriota bacterium]
MSLIIHQGKSDELSTVVRLEGRLMLGPSCAELEALIEHEIAQGRRRLVFDLSTLTAMDSTGLGRFIDAHQKLEELGGELRIAGAAGSVREMLRVTKLDTVFSLYPTVQAASA